MDHLPQVEEWEIQKCQNVLYFHEKGFKFTIFVDQMKTVTNTILIRAVTFCKRYYSKNNKYINNHIAHYDAAKKVQHLADF